MALKTRRYAPGSYAITGPDGTEWIVTKRRCEWTSAIFWMAIDSGGGYFDCETLREIKAAIEKEG